MSTLGARPHHGGLALPRSCVARRVAALGAAALPPAAEHPPMLSTVANSIHSVLWFCKIRPNFELKAKFHQNESCAEFPKLQNICW